MTAENVIESLNNAWRSLCIQYDDLRDENIRVALNKLSEIIRKVESEYKKAKEEENKPPQQITIEEWLEWLNSDDD